MHETRETKLRLTDISVRQLPLTDKGQRRIRDDVLPGFGVTVGTRAKTFFVMYGEDRRLKTLGRYPDVSLSEARKEAKRFLAHPTPEKRLERLSDALTAYLADCETKNRPSTVKEYRRMLALIPDKPLSKVERSDLTKPTSHQIMAWRIFFNWCIKHELVERNPFNHIATPIGRRERVLTPEEISALWQIEDRPLSDIWKLLLLTGQRRNQIWKLQQDWVQEDTIHFPGSIMKNGHPHIIPFGPLAANLMTTIPFNFNGWTKAKARLDRKAGVFEYRLHDLRRTMSTIHASIGTPIHLTELLLNHRTGKLSGVTGIYNRYSYLGELRKCVLQYEEHIGKLVESSG